MRVIAGQAKGRKLRLVSGAGTRPITDRVKENLFNLLQWDVPGSQFLDLFAGTGSVGIEALSRGAAGAVFLDVSREAISAIHANLVHCGLEDRASVCRTDAFTFLSNDPADSYDIIYVAPPQYQGMWVKALQALDRRPDWLSADGQVVVQIHPKEHEAITWVHLELVDQRTYGSTVLCFYERVGIHQ